MPHPSRTCDPDLGPRTSRLGPLTPHVPCYHPFFAMPSTLLAKVWNAHAVRTLPNGQTQLFIGLHLIHEVTSPQAFDMLRARGWDVRFPERTIATVDHIVPTRDQRRPFLDVMAEDMFAALERNCREEGIRLF